MIDSLPWMLDQTGHEQSEEQYSFYQHQNHLIKPAVHNIRKKGQLHSLWKMQARKQQLQYALLLLFQTCGRNLYLILYKNSNKELTQMLIHCVLNHVEYFDGTR